MNPFKKFRQWQSVRREEYYREKAEGSVYFDTCLFVDDTGRPYTKMYLCVDGIKILEVMPTDKKATHLLQIDNVDAVGVLEYYRKEYINMLIELDR